LQLAQLVELHLAIDVCLDFVHVALQAAEHVAQRARDLGQALGPDDDQRNDADDEDLGKADVKHAPSRARGRRVTLEARSSRRLFLLRFAFDRLADDLLRRLGALRRGLALRTLHAVLEAFHRAAQVLADVAQLLGPEDQHDDEQHDQPVPDAQSTHIVLLYYMPGLGSILPSGSGPPMICTCRCMTSWRPMRPV